MHYVNDNIRRLKTHQLPYFALQAARFLDLGETSPQHLCALRGPDALHLVLPPRVNLRALLEQPAN